MSAAGRRRWADLPRQPGWLAGLAVAVAVAVACVALGQWQWQRKQDRDARNAAVTTNWDRAPAGLDAVLDGTGAVPASAEWSPVSVVGRWDAGATVLVRNRPLDRRNGYLVATPLVLDRPVAGRDELWLVRGWVAAGDDAAEVPGVEAPPGGDVTVVARLRPPERGRAWGERREAPAGQAYRTSPGALGAAAGREPDAAVQGVGVVAAGQPGAAGLAALPRPATEPGPHFAYTLQWWLFAAAALVVWGVLYRRPVPGAAPGVPAGRAAAGDPWVYRPDG